jgi:hypothetical protein
MLIAELERQISADVTSSSRPMQQEMGFGLLFICKIKWLPLGSHFILQYQFARLTRTNIPERFIKARTNRCTRL